VVTDYGGRHAMQFEYVIQESLATVTSVHRSERLTKWAYLESLSTTTITTLWPCERESPSMKSMLISVHTVLGIGKGGGLLVPHF
jgi:hypothetical protein